MDCDSGKSESGIEQAPVDRDLGDIASRLAGRSYNVPPKSPRTHRDGGFGAPPWIKEDWGL